MVHSSGKVETGKFNHVAITYDGSVIHFYINGQPAGAGNIASNTDNVTNVLIGADYYQDNPSGFFKGKIAEVRIWDKARSQGEIERDMNQRLSGNETNLVGYWRLDKITVATVTDLASGFNGTVSGNPSLTEDETFFEYGSLGTQAVKTSPPTVMYFDGNDDVNCGNGINLANSSFTISFWAKRNTIDGNQQCVLGQAQNSNPDLNYGLLIGFRNTNKFFMAFWGNAIDSDASYTDTNWHHWSCTFNHSTKEQIIYRDGVLIKQRNADSNCLASGDFLLGCCFGKIDYFRGLLAEVQVWNQVLTQQQIQDNMYQRLSGTEIGLLGYWTLDNAFLEGTTRKTHDLVGNHNGTLIGTYVVEDSSFPFTPSLTNTAAYRVGYFDGNDYLNCGSAINLANKSFTIDFWAKRGNISGVSQFIVGQGTGSANNGLHIGFRGNNTFTFAFYSNDLNTSSIYTNTEEWHHWSCTYNSSTKLQIIYCDGEQVSARQATANFQGIGNFYLGSRYAANDKFTGEVSEVRIWNYPRSATEVQLNYNKRLTGEEPGLLAYYPLNQIDMVGTNPQVLDVANNHHGTPYDMAIIDDLSLPIISNLLAIDVSIDAFPLSQVNTAINYDAVITSIEYGTYEVDPISKQKSAMMRRMFAYLTGDGVQFLPDKRIETLELLWIGNAQFKPTLLGFMEGAPPVPSENMNIDGDYQYNGATSVALTTTEDVEYSWNRAQDAGLGGSADLFLGVDSKTFAGIGVATSIEETHLGFKGTLDFSYQWLNESNVASSSSLAMTDRLELRGAPEVEAKFPHLGRRFMPKNVGYALVVSSLADVFISRLSRSKKWWVMKLFQ